jgi:hypothetical protein
MRFLSDVNQWRGVLSGQATAEGGGFSFCSALCPLVMIGCLAGHTACLESAAMRSQRQTHQKEKPSWLTG